MAYDEWMAERVRGVLRARGVPFAERRMMGGLAIMVDEKMLCGIASARDTGEPRLMARVGAKAAAELLDSPQVVAWDLSPSRMRDYVNVGAAGLDGDADLERWLDRCLAFNPRAKASKRRKRT